MSERAMKGMTNGKMANATNLAKMANLTMCLGTLDKFPNITKFHIFVTVAKSTKIVNSVAGFGEKFRIRLYVHFWTQVIIQVKIIKINRLSYAMNLSNPLNFLLLETSSNCLGRSWNPSTKRPERQLHSWVSIFATAYLATQSA